MISFRAVTAICLGATLWVAQTADVAGVEKESGGANIVVVDTAKDFEGNEYPAIRIGDQVWTITNLRSTKYNDGTPIPHVTELTEWQKLKTPAYCFYQNSTDTAEQKKYGALYNWYTVNTGKLAPEGWRVPTDADWTVLENYLIANGYNWDGKTTGNEIAKSLASKTDDWRRGRVPGTIGNDLSKNNASGFSGLPGGYHRIDNFFYRGLFGLWWSASELDADYAWQRNIYYGRVELNKELRYGRKGGGLSVRLLRD